MEENTAAIVLRKTAYTDSSAVITTYSRNHGKLSFMVRGLGKKSARNAAVQPLTRVEISYGYRQSRSVQMVRSIRILGSAAPDFSHPVKASVALFLAEVLYKALREETPDHDLYDYIDAAVTFFEENPPNGVFHLQLMAKLTRLLGFLPSGAPSAEKPYFDLENGEFTAHRNASLHLLQPEETALFFRLAGAELDEEFHISREAKRRMIHHLATYYRLHLEGFGELKSLPILTELFS